MATWSISVSMDPPYRRPVTPSSRRGPGITCGCSLAATSMLARAELRRAWRTLLALGLLAGATLGIALARRAGGAPHRRPRTTAWWRRPAPRRGRCSCWATSERARAVTRLPEVAEQLGDRPGGVAPRSIVARSRTSASSPAPTAPPPGLFTPIFVDGHAARSRRRRPTSSSPSGSRASSASHVGDRVPLSFLTPSGDHRSSTPGSAIPTGPSLPMRVVGIVRLVDRRRVELDPGVLDPGAGPPARRRPASSAPDVFVRLRDGPDALPAFQRSVQQLATASQPDVGAGEFLGYQVQSPLRQRAGGRRDDAGARRRTRRVRAHDRARGTARVRAHLASVLRRVGALACLAHRARRDPRHRCGGRAWRRRRPSSRSAPVVALVAGARRSPGSDRRAAPPAASPIPGWCPNVALLLVGAVVVAFALVAVAALAGELASTRRRVQPDRVRSRRGSDGAAHRPRSCSGRASPSTPAVAAVRFRSTAALAGCSRRGDRGSSPSSSGRPASIGSSTQSGALGLGRGRVPRRRATSDRPAPGRRSAGRRRGAGRRGRSRPRGPDRQRERLHRAQGLGRVDRDRRPHARRRAARSCSAPVSPDALDTSTSAPGSP